MNCIMDLKMYMMWISATLVVQGSNVEDEMYKTCLKTPCVCCKNRICSSHGKCNGCIDGFTGSSCTEPCPPNCFNCSQSYYLNSISDKVCYHCKNGFYNGKHKDVPQYTVQNDCRLSCITGCEICTSYNSCTRCKKGYFMSANTCVKCPYNCNTCLSPVTCVKCEDGFYLNGTICGKCLLNCKTCYSPDVCTECNTNYFLSEDGCMRCPNACLYCSTKSSCTTCQSGYYLDSNQCFECKENCVSCSLNEHYQYICKQCRDEYYVFNGTCMKCGTGCVFCESHNDCYACISGFILQSNVCYNNETTREDTSFESSADTNTSLSVDIIAAIVISCIVVVVLVVIAVVFRNREITCGNKRFSIASCCGKDNSPSHKRETNDEVARQSLLASNKLDAHNDEDNALIASGVETIPRIDNYNSQDDMNLVAPARDNQTECENSGPAPATEDNTEPKQAREESVLNGSIENKQEFERSASRISIDESSQGPDKTSTSTDMCTRIVKPKIKVDKFEDYMNWITREDYDKQYMRILEEIKPESKDFQKRVDTVMPIYDYYKEEKKDAAYIVYIESKDNVVNKERKVWREIWNRRITIVVMLRYGTSSGELDDEFVLKSEDSTENDMHVKCENINENAHFTLKTYSILQAEERREVTLFDMPCPCGNESTSPQDRERRKMNVFDVSYPSGNDPSPRDRESREFTLFHMPCSCGNKSGRTACALMELQKAINKLNKDSSCPTLFHCSDENREVLGTVGIYIAYDQLVKNEKETGYIEVYLCVKELLKQCPHLIQKSPQYECIHSVLVEWIKARKRPIMRDCEPKARDSIPEHKNVIN